MALGYTGSSAVKTTSNTSSAKAANTSATLNRYSSNNTATQSVSKNVNATPWSSATYQSGMSSANSAKQAATFSSSGNSGGGVSVTSPSISSGNQVTNSSNAVGSISSNAANSLSDYSDLIEQSHSYDVESRSYSAAEAQKEREWAEYMRGTAYQATVKDLIAAGLNPVLAAKIGATSTPTGSSSTGDFNSTSSLLSGIVSSAVSASIAESNRQNVLDQISNSKELAYISGYFGVQQSQISAGGIIGAAQLNAAATQYSSNNALIGTLDHNAKALEGTKYSADSDYSKNLVTQSMNYIIEQEFPKNEWSLVKGGMQQILNNIDFRSGQYGTCADVVSSIAGQLDRKYKK